MRDEITMRVVRSDGRVMHFDGTTGWAIEQDDSPEWSPMSLSVNTSANVLTDGSSLVSKRINEVDRTAKAYYFGDKPEREARSEAQSFFNPKFSFKVYVTYLGLTRWCEGELIGFATEDNNASIFPTIQFTILCLDPYFRSEDGNESAFGDSIPMFGFPFTSHFREALPDGTKRPVGFMASNEIFDGKNTLWNNGDVPTNYTIRIEAKGELKNPTITKDGRFVRLLLTMYEGDVVEIDFNAAPPTVTKNGQNVIHYASRDSAFTKMAMQVGKNIFSFTIDNEENRSLAKVQVLFHKKYLGV
ncbi:MAG: phage tail family protein [Clostridia bacterium]|nr:phage tail family protein [Clostridia bacterium]